MFIRKLNKSGETIVEVLISLSVLGLTLGLSYGIASRSLNNSRDAQERTEAFQYAQSNIETIKALANRDLASDPTNLDPIIHPPTGTREFCVDTEDIQFADSGTPVNYNPNNAMCNKDRYTSRVTATRVSPATAQPQIYRYTVDINWEPLGGNLQTHNVQMIYEMAK